MTEQKSVLVLNLASFILIILNLFLIPWYSGVICLALIFGTLIICLCEIFALRLIIKDLIVYRRKHGNPFYDEVTARKALLIQVVIFLGLFILPLVTSVIVFTGMDYTVFIFWGISSILNVIAAVLYKKPVKYRSTSWICIQI